eukprot:11179621-Karenia_brevis.AAC.1
MLMQCINVFSCWEDAALARTVTSTNSFFPCKLCGKMQPQNKYALSMWKHRVDQKPSCNDCKPPDVEPTCQ